MDDHPQTSGDKSGGIVIVAVIGFVVVIALSVRACHPVAGTPNAAITTPAPQAAPAQQPAQPAEASQPGNILFEIGKEIHGSHSKDKRAHAWVGVPVPTYDDPPKGMQTITSPSETNHGNPDAQENYSAVIPGRVYYDFYPRLGLRDSTHKLQCYEKPAQAWLTVSPGSTCSDAAGYRVQCTNGSGSPCPFEYYWSPAATH